MPTTNPEVIPGSCSPRCPPAASTSCRLATGSLLAACHPGGLVSTQALTACPLSTAVHRDLPKTAQGPSQATPPLDKDSHLPLRKPQIPSRTSGAPGPARLRPSPPRARSPPGWCRLRPRTFSVLSRDAFLPVGHLLCLEGPGPLGPLPSSFPGLPGLTSSSDPAASYTGFFPPPALTCHCHLSVSLTRTGPLRQGLPVSLPYTGCLAVPVTRHCGQAAGPRRSPGAGLPSRPRCGS